MDEHALEEVKDWAAYWKYRAEELEVENERLEDVVDDLKTRLIMRQDEIIALQRTRGGV